MEEEILHERSLSGAVIYISEFQNKLAWKLGISVSLALEDMTLTEWYDLVHSFALMPPLTDQDAVARYLGRLEKGIPIRDKGSTRLGNGPPDTRLLKLRRLRSTRVPMSTPRSL